MAKKSKKKILYVITKSVLGGAGKYVYDLATNLPKDKFEVFVAAGGEGPLAQKIGEAGIPYYQIINFQKGINVLKELLAYFEILRLLLKIKPDIVHVNSSKAGGIVGQAALDYRFLSFNFKLKTVFTAHGWAFHESRPWWQIFLIRIFTTLTAFYYSKIICVSEFDRLSAIKNRVAPKRKLITVHNGIDFGDYQFLEKEEARQKLNIGKLDRDEILLGTVGEFTKNKGQEYFIDAVQKIQNTGYKMQTIIIGWGEEFENLKFKIKNLGLENSVFLINNLPHAAPYLKAFDIFVLPSIKEGLPYTILEAGLAGLPVVATKVGGIPEIIENQREGLLVKTADADDLADKIEEFIENPEKRKQMADNLWHKVIREFSLEKMLSSTLATYE